MKRLLDLFCGAGGAAMGYHRAGFEVVGVDIKPQPRYPFEFHQADAIEFVREHGQEFDAIHASPPCQLYSTTAALHTNKNYPDLVPATRYALEQLDKPWVIENVIGSPLRWGVILCGVMFGLKTFRHRCFESRDFMWQPEHKKHPEVIGRRGEGVSPSGYCNPCGHPKMAGQGQKWKEALQIDWMTIRELTQAIPPAYTEFIGKQLMRAMLQADCTK
jgi:DNA (cytosine-5)-methyltransferase 1